MRPQATRLPLNEHSPHLALIHPDVEPAPGMLAIAELTKSTHVCSKIRPVILQSFFAGGRRCRAWALTTVPRFAEGRRRLRLYDLPIPGTNFLWSPTLTAFDASMIHGAVWACPPEPLMAVAEAAGSPFPAWAASLADELAAAGWYDWQPEHG